MPPPADAKTKSTPEKLLATTSCVTSSFPFQKTFFPADLEEDKRIKLETGKFLSSSIFNSSQPTAPEEPRIATVKGLFGKNGDFLKPSISFLK